MQTMRWTNNKQNDRSSFIRKCNYKLFPILRDNETQITVSLDHIDLVYISSISNIKYAKNQ